jgi:hypothetical protein
VYIRTSAYLNRRKVSAVKKLLELIVVLLSSDDRVATASGFLEFFAIENLDSSTERFDQLTVLQVICGFRNGGGVRSRTLRRKQ